MDRVTKLEVLQLWQSKSEIRQRSMMKDYLDLYQGMSSNDWLLYLEKIFEMGGWSRRAWIWRAWCIEFPRFNN